MAYRESTLSLNDIDIYDNYLVTNNDYTINADASYKPIIVTLPDPNTCIGQIFCINAKSITSTTIEIWKTDFLNLLYATYHTYGFLPTGCYLSSILYIKDSVGDPDLRLTYYKNSTSYGSTDFHITDTDPHEIIMPGDLEINKVEFYNFVADTNVKATLKYQIKSKSSLVNNITINTVSGLINDLSTFTFTDTIYKSITVQSIGTGYVILWSYVKLVGQP